MSCSYLLPATMFFTAGWLIVVYGDDPWSALLCDAAFLACWLYGLRERRELAPESVAVPAATTATEEV